MAPSSGLFFVPKALRAAHTVTRIIRDKAAKLTYAKRPLFTGRFSLPIHPAALLRRSKQRDLRWFRSQARNFIKSLDSAGTSHSSTKRFNETGSLARTLRQNGSLPFASTLRPNLTGGTLSRATTGYTLSGVGRSRFFSQTSTCQAHVMQNVHAGIRAFVHSGSKITYNGQCPVTGVKRYRSITKSQDTFTRMVLTEEVWNRGTTVEFSLTPIITALTPNSPTSGSCHSVNNLRDEGTLEALLADFTCSFKALRMVYEDIKKLQLLGNLPLVLRHTPQGPVLSVRFPGCDAKSVGSLCDEVGVVRGIIVEDDEWTTEKEPTMTFMFPFAPSTNEGVLDSPSLSISQNPLVKKHLQTGSMDSSDGCWVRSEQNPSDPAGSVPPWSVSSESQFISGDLIDSSSSSFRAPRAQRSSDFEGLEGIYKFLQICDESKAAI